MSVANAKSPVSGLVVDGVDKSAYLATRLLNKLWWIRRCAIAIVNETDHTLSRPQHYQDAGLIESMPVQIGPYQTGLVGAYKTAVLASGTSGVISYEVNRLNSIFHYLQVMWSVPYIGSNFVNVALGAESPSEGLFRQMYKGNCGQLQTAVETSCTIPLGECHDFTADVYMGAESHAVLVVHIKSENYDRYD